MTVYVVLGEDPCNARQDAIAVCSSLEKAHDAIKETETETEAKWGDGYDEFRIEEWEVDGEGKEVFRSL